MERSMNSFGLTRVNVLRLLFLLLATGVLLPAGASRGAPSGKKTMEKPRRSGFPENYAANKTLRPDRPGTDLTLAIERAWATFSYLPGEFPAARWTARLRNMRDEAYFRRAFSYYRLSLELYEKYRKTLGGLRAERRVTRDPLWWKELERRDTLARRESKEREDYHRRLSLVNRRVFSTLDRIASSALRAERRFLVLRKIAYRRYAIHETNLGRYPSALSILSHYARYPGTEREWPFHYYLGRVYRGLYRAALRHPGVSEDKRKKLLQQGDAHYLNAVELKFGRKSREYSYAQNRIRYR